MKSHVLHTVWCYSSGEAAGEIWNWSLLGVKWLILLSLRTLWTTRPLVALFKRLFWLYFVELLSCLLLGKTMFYLRLRDRLMNWTIDRSNIRSADNITFVHLVPVDVLLIELSKHNFHVVSPRRDAASARFYEVADAVRSRQYPLIIDKRPAAEDVAIPGLLESGLPWPVLVRHDEGPTNDPLVFSKPAHAAFSVLGQIFGRSKVDIACFCIRFESSKQIRPACSRATPSKSDQDAVCDALYTPTKLSPPLPPPPTPHSNPLPTNVAAHTLGYQTSTEAKSSEIWSNNLFQRIYESKSSNRHLIQWIERKCSDDVTCKPWRTWSGFLARIRIDTNSCVRTSFKSESFELCCLVAVCAYAPNIAVDRVVGMWSVCGRYKIVYATDHIPTVQLVYYYRRMYGIRDPFGAESGWPV